jgi:protocatechuate 3,4-dioxygenase beta subunit
MKKILISILLPAILTACVAAPTEIASSPLSTPEAVLASPTVSIPNAPTATSASASDDFFNQNGILLPAPVCTGVTQEQTEGPYYIAGSPQSNILYEEGMQGTRLIVVGYVLDQNCQPLPNAWLDFWQADASGEYDNAGYSLRGHQFTDSQGRFYLDTVFPGLYSNRPIEHIHVKVKPEGGAEITSQLYFPGQPIEGLTVIIEERDGYLVGYFDFVVQK